MAVSPSQHAIHLAALLFIRGKPTLECNFSEVEMDGLKVLQHVKAVVACNYNSRDASCAYCGLHRGPIFQDTDGLMVQCPACGPFPLDLASHRSWRLDDEWLIRKMRSAMNINANASATCIVEGIWEIGNYQKKAVLLARRIDMVALHGLRIFLGTNSRLNGWVITPKPLAHVPDDPLAGAATWWLMEDRFAIHGMALRLLREELDGDVQDVEALDSSSLPPIYGPFTEDFQWVHLSGWDHGPIRLTKAQSSFFTQLWKHRSQALTGEFLLREAGLASEKPMDLFKVKSSNRGDPLYEGPLKAYEILVAKHRRLGLYQLKWSP